MKVGPLAGDRLWAAAAFVAAGLLLLLSYASWSRLGVGMHVGLPGVSLWDETLLFQAPAQIKAALGLVLLQLAAAAIGYGFVIQPIWGGKGLVSAPWLLLAGTIPGVLLMIPVARLATLVLPNTSAPFVVLAIDLAAAVAAAALAWRRAGSERTPADWRGIGLIAVLLVLALVFEVQFDIFHVAGEAILFFIDQIFTTQAFGVGAPGHWPLISQHYDEAGFLYPIIYGWITPGGEVRGSLILLYWIHLAVGRLAMASLIYVALRGLGLDRLSSLVVLLFVLGASLSLNPVAGRLLFDSGSPLGIALHVSRMLIPVMPLLFVSAVANAGQRTSWPSLVLALVFGLGLSSLAIHVLLVLPWAVGALALTGIAPGAARAPALWRALCLAGVVVIAGLLGAYGVHAFPVPVRAGVLLASGAAATAAIGWALFRSLRNPQVGQGDRLLRFVPILAALIVGYGFGLALLGNVGVHEVAKVLGGFWPWRGVAIVDRFSSELFAGSQAAGSGLLCEQGYEWTTRTLAGHCASAPIFARTYGLAPFVLTAFAGWWLWTGQRPTTAEDRALTPAFWGLVLCLLALPAAFLLFDFVGGAPTDPDARMAIWIRSRLLEPWFYSGPILAAALWLPRASRRERGGAQALMLAAVAVAGLSPLLLPAQLVVNASYLAGALRP